MIIDYWSLTPRLPAVHYFYQNDFMHISWLSLFLFLFLVSKTKAQKPDFSNYPIYNGNDLGLTYSPTQSFFRIWSPTATEIKLLLYNQGFGSEAVQVLNMRKDIGGTWTIRIPGNQKGKYYTFQAYINGKWMNEVPDPYAKAVGVNGRRGVIFDRKETNPPSWQNDKSPVFRNKTDAIIYELHVRDASIHANSGIESRGKFLGLAEKNTKTADSLYTGLSHMKELGITHVHLLPFYDFFTVDESKLDSPQYNWGYDPLNYNTPEGSYSTNPKDGITRIKEFKQLIKSLHDNGIRVIMDVVYNHTMLTDNSYFNQLVPGYYYRQKEDGSFSDATACGNETASERPMMRKFILESVLYWVKEFHVDGFRFDLMGVHDIQTMNILSKELHRIKPDILLYGEGWTAGACPLPDSLRALKKNAYRLDRIAVFSDDIRDGIKGSVFDHKDRGFASGKPGMEESIKFGVVASTKHPQVDYSKVNYSKAAYAAQPYQTVSYCECHDNHVLWDKIAISADGTSEADRKEMHKLALSIVLTSQGISFLHAGTEFLRSKQGNENSFNAGDGINAIDWSLKSTNKDVFDYVKGLIAIRKKHPAFRMTETRQIVANLVFVTNPPQGIVAYSINGAAVNDNWRRIFVIYNGSGSQQSIKLPTGSWKAAVDGNKVLNGTKTFTGNINSKARSCTILFQ